MISETNFLNSYSNLTPLNLPILGPSIYAPTKAIDPPAR